jgi:hypothetical protein
MYLVPPTATKMTTTQHYINEQHHTPQPHPSPSTLTVATTPLSASEKVQEVDASWSLVCLFFSYLFFISLTKFLDPFYNNDDPPPQRPPPSLRKALPSPVS